VQSHFARDSLPTKPARRYLGPDYGDAGAVGERDAVTAAQVPGLARQSFPLCMALMAQHLHADHHLRHGGRIQLGLFLKVPPFGRRHSRNEAAPTS
jgi:DNA primase large subunit